MSNPELPADNTQIEDYLEEDKPIPGQKYVCLSFISPEKVLEDKKTYQFLYIIYTAQIFLLISSLLLANNFSVILFLLSIPYLLILRKIYLMKNLKNYLEVFQFNNYTIS